MRGRGGRETRVRRVFSPPPSGATEKTRFPSPASLPLPQTQQSAVIKTHAQRTQKNAATAKPTKSQVQEMCAKSLSFPSIHPPSYLWTSLT